MGPWSLRLRSALAAAVSLALLATAGSALAGDGKLVAPEAGSPEAALLAGLELIKAGKFDQWVDTLCHKEDLCYNDNSVASVKKYNLPAMQRLAPKCLKDGGKLEVTKVDDKGDGYKVIFAVCDPKGMPRPFHLKLAGKDWKFKKI